MLELLSTILLPSQTANIKTEAHTCKTESEYQGNALADFPAKPVSPEMVRICNFNELCKTDPGQLSYDDLPNKWCNAPDLEKQNWYLEGYKFNVKYGHTEGPDGHLVLSESLKLPLLKAVCSIIHHGTNKMIQIIKNIGG